MKKKFSTSILFIVLLLLLGLYYFVTNYNGFDNQGKVIDFKNGHIIELEITSEKTDFKFVKENDVWKIHNDKIVKLDRKYFNHIEYVLNNLKYSRVVQGTPSDFSSFGLIKPRFRITIRTDNNISEVLYCGDLTPSKNEYYVRKDNSEKVYLINKGNLDLLIGDISFYKDKKIISIDTELLDSIEINSVSAGRFVFHKSDNKWKLVFPVKAEIKNDIMAEVINKLVNIQVMEFIALNNDNIKKYNLDKSDYQITVGDSKNKYQKIIFGKKENERVYLTTDDKKEIYAMSLMTFSGDDIKIGELLNETPLSIGIDKVKKIVFTDSNHQIEIKKEDSKPDYYFTINGREVNIQDLNSLYINIMAVKATGLGVRHYSRPEFSIILEQIYPDQNIIAEFVRKDHASYYMFLNKNTSNFTVSSTQIEEIRKWIKRI